MKSIKILFFGNSYGNDAVAYLERMLKSHFEEIIIGRAGDSSMAINDHYHNIDDDPDNDFLYHGKPFAVHYKTVNGEKFELPGDYKTIMVNEPWDYVIFYQGPNSSDTLTKPEYYSELDNFLSALRKYMTNPNGKIVYYMTWAHNVSDTLSLYNGIVKVTRELITNHPEINGVIPAATLIENLRTSYLKSGVGGDITRDWGHLNYGVGRFAMAMLWYTYLTGGTSSDIDFMPTFETETRGDIAKQTEWQGKFTDVDESNLKVIKESVNNAIKHPYTVTESTHKTIIA